MSMPPPLASPRLHHIALTVTDLAASTAWYQGVFGVHPVLDVPHPGGTAKVLADPEKRLMFALHRHDASDGRAFSETRTGLDHVGLAVPSRAELTAWQDHLESHGVARAEHADRPLTQSPITEAPYAAVLVFRDPDNIQLELFAPPRAIPR